MLLLGRLAGYAALKSVDEIKAALLAGYALPTTHPTAAASLLSLLPEDGCAVGLLPTEVTIQVYVDRLHALDPVAQSYGLDGYLRAWWRDPRLRFNASEAASCGATPTLSLTRTESLAIWRPDLYWEKALTVVLPEPQMGFTTGAGELLSVGPEGDVFWSRQARFTLACPMSLARLPFDTQRCSFIAGLYSQTAERVSLAWRDGAEALAGWRAAACVTGWVMSGLEQVSELQSYVSGNYTYARATLSFTRAPNRFVQQYMVQSIIMVIISWLGFLIDPTATPARVALGIITVMVVLQNYIALSNSLPSDIHGTWLGMFTLVSFLFNILAFVEQVLVSFGIQASASTARSRLDGSWFDPSSTHPRPSLPFPAAAFPHRAACRGSLYHTHARAACLSRRPQAEKWLEAQRKLIASVETWEQASSSQASRHESGIGPCL